MKEIKARVNDVDELNKRLHSLGAVREATLQVHNIYFHQPPGYVLKISSDETGDFLNRLQANQSGGFDLISSELIEDLPATRQELAMTHGEKSVLNKIETYYQVPGKSYSVILTSIQNVGNFLVLQDENPTVDFLSSEFGIVNPQLISVPFDELEANE